MAKKRVTRERSGGRVRRNLGSIAQGLRSHAENLDNLGVHVFPAHIGGTRDAHIARIEAGCDSLTIVGIGLRQIADDLDPKAVA